MLRVTAAVKIICLLNFGADYKTEFASHTKTSNGFFRLWSQFYAESVLNYSSEKVVGSVDT